MYHISAICLVFVIFTETMTPVWMQECHCYAGIHSYFILMKPSIVRWIRDEMIQRGKSLFFFFFSTRQSKAHEPKQNRHARRLGRQPRHARHLDAKMDLAEDSKLN